MVPWQNSLNRLVDGSNPSGPTRFRVHPEPHWWWSPSSARELTTVLASALPGGASVPDPMRGDSPSSKDSNELTAESPVLDHAWRTHMNAGEYKSRSACPAARNRGLGVDDLSMGQTAGDHGE